MTWLVPLLLVLHVVPAVFWAGSTAVLARPGTIALPLPLRAPQTGSAAGAIIFGMILWGMLHRGDAGTPEYVLGAGALCALTAFALQQLVAWPALRRDPEGGAARFASAQRISSILLIVALSAMVTFRYA
ncbi:MAG: hypothetical protein H0W74_12660 [Sphingosinicella sp.]|nr:hypothetical protein [Sphingosinicella sp.]